MKYQLIEESELETAPDGFYKVIGKDKTGDYYDPARDEISAGVELELLARIRANEGPLPKGCERAIIREDGKQLITVWSRQDALETR